jgi:hypothetical protein
MATDAQIWLFGNKSLAVDFSHSILLSPVRIYLMKDAPDEGEGNQCLSVIQNVVSPLRQLDPVLFPYATFKHVPKRKNQ